MSCNCNQPKPVKQAPRKGVVKFCDICDPCNEAVSNVRLCAFVVPTLEEGRYYKNSFIFVQEDDSVYFISDDRSEIPFGSRPKFIEDFDPNDAAVTFKSTVVYDVKNQTGYVYDPEGNRMSIALTAAPFSSLTGEDGVIVTSEGGNYTAKADTTILATVESVEEIQALATANTRRINAIKDTQDQMAGDIETLQDAVDEAHDLADEANELAVQARTEAAAAQSTANAASAAAAGKQDALTAGENITIQNNVISASVASYQKATTSNNGLMSNKDREQTINTGFYKPASTASPSASNVVLNFTKNVSNADGSNYTSSNEGVTIPAATQQVAGVMTAADKTALDNRVQITLTDTDPGAGGTLAANNFIVVYEA